MCKYKTKNKKLYVGGTMPYKISLLILLLTIIFIPLLTDYTMSRGTEPGSFFYSNLQYSNQQGEYHAVFYTPDNGETFIRRYFYNPLYGRRILSDAQPGVIYLYNRDTFDVSYDLGNTWQFVEEPGNSAYYASGTLPGEIYKWDSGYLYRSLNHGYDYELMSEVFWFCNLEIGNTVGEVYCLCDGIDGEPSDSLYIRYSENFGETFNNYVIDPFITEPSITSIVYKLFKGTQQGELFMVTLNHPWHHRIYLSNDFGQTFELKFQGEDYDEVGEGYDFTAGNESGSFYIMKVVQDILPDQINLHITFYHSTDYAETFTEEYYHYFDDTFENPDYIIPYPSSLEVETQAENVEFNITSNINWWIECEDDWIISIIPISGSGDETINLNYEENTSNLERTAELIISGENCEPEVVTIYQSSSVGINENQEIGISNFRLSNYPNPFTTHTIISFNLTAKNAKNAKINVYNIKGQKVKQLVSTSADQLSAGKHSVVWNGNDESGKPLNSGIYLYKLNIDGRVVARKMVLIE